MSLSELRDTLHPFERKLLPFITQNTPLDDILTTSKLSLIEATRAVQWLENKQIITKKEQTIQDIKLGTNGKIYARQGFPELRVLQELPATMEELEKKGLAKQEIGVSLGILKQNKLAIIEGPTIKPSGDSSKFLQQLKEDQLYLQKVDTGKTSEVKQELLKRKDILNVKDVKKIELSLTPLGQQLVAQGIPQHEMLQRLTPSHLSTKSWKGKEFRRYDVAINVPSINLAKIHPISQAVRYVKEIWLEMGFQEMTGDFIQTAFWDLDALFVPQDHPAREVQDTFYLQDQPKGKLPKIARAIKEVHEDGGKTGSSGWGGTWDEKVASENLLRTHTTVLSAKTLARLKETDLPAKFFAVGEVFRNEALDWKHLFEFHQLEGIVVDPNANIRHLIGYLRQFYRKMGFPDVRVRPDHFPYTEPSLVVEVYHPEKKQWLELGGAGIFRPEVVIPLLGKDIPVLAWGQGLSRIITSYYGFTDIRDLYTNNLEQLRNTKLWLR